MSFGRLLPRPGLYAVIRSNDTHVSFSKGAGSRIDLLFAGSNPRASTIISSRNNERVLWKTLVKDIYFIPWNGTMTWSELRKTFKVHELCTFLT